MRQPGDGVGIGPQGECGGYRCGDGDARVARALPAQIEPRVVQPLLDYDSLADDCGKGIRARDAVFNDYTPRGEKEPSVRIERPRRPDRWDHGHDGYIQEDGERR